MATNPVCSVVALADAAMHVIFKSTAVHGVVHLLLTDGADASHVTQDVFHEVLLPQFCREHLRTLRTFPSLTISIDQPEKTRVE